MVEWLLQSWHTFVQAVGAANPVWLFLAVAVLPLFGMPTSPLLVAIGIRLGTAAGLALVMAAYVFNFTAGYWLARNWFRAPLGRWLERRGHRIPSVPAAEETQFILLVRITPGPPLFMQTYILGFARVGFVRYLFWSLFIQLFYGYAFLSFGRSLQHNAVWHALLAVALLIGLGLALNLLRHHLKSGRSKP
jgi:uncharacterized membrane protein YdjX (TVP38/TMEM64 family)